MRLHATAVAIDGVAILLRGAPGAGKSDLALRLIDGGARLVSDDQCELRRVEGRLLASAPTSIAGLIEIRGIGLLRVDAVDDVPVVLLVDLAAPEAVERLPRPRAELVLGVAVPVLALAPFEASLPAKLRLALRALAAGDGLEATALGVPGGPDG